MHHFQIFNFYRRLQLRHLTQLIIQKKNLYESPENSILVLRLQPPTKTQSWLPCLEGDKKKHLQCPSQRTHLPAPFFILLFEKQKPICHYCTSTHLVKELFSCGVILDGKLQLRIHGGHTNINLGKKKKCHFLYYMRKHYCRGIKILIKDNLTTKNVQRFVSFSCLCPCSNLFLDINSNSACSIENVNEKSGICSVNFMIQQDQK